MGACRTQAPLTSDRNPYVPGAEDTGTWGRRSLCLGEDSPPRSSPAQAPQG